MWNNTNKSKNWINLKWSEQCAKSLRLLNHKLTATLFIFDFSRTLNCTFFLLLVGVNVFEYFFLAGTSWNSVSSTVAVIIIDIVDFVVWFMIFYLFHFFLYYFIQPWLLLWLRMIVQITWNWTCFFFSTSF